MRRRELLLAGVAVALARPAAASADEPRDGDIVKALIAREEGSAYAYRGLRLPGVTDAAGQDADHVKALRTELQALGRGTAPVTLEQLDAPTRRLAEASLAREKLAAARALETELVAAYRQAVIELVQPAIVQTVATILACHAQRRALLARASYPA